MASPLVAPFNMDLEFEEVYIEKELVVPTHKELEGRDEPDQHKIESITGLREELDDKVNLEVPATARVGNFVLYSGEGTETVCKTCPEDYVLKSEVSEILKPQCYVHTQSVPADRWTVVHNLNRIPSVVVVDDTGTVVVGDVTHVDMNTLIIDFTVKFSGKACIN